jgi:UDP:flavonoid glycosyltransferase YjiC (YdhE family)
MRIIITTVGTRGDVQPYVALGKGLKAAGHAVTIGTHPLFEELIRGHGLGFAPIRVDPRLVFDRDLSQIGGNPIGFGRWMIEQLERQIAVFVEDAIPALADADAVLFSTFAYVAYHIAEKQGIPALAVYLQPATPTRAFSSPTAPAPAWLPGLVNWLSFKLSNQMFFQMVEGITNAIRQERLGLPKVTRGWLWRLDTSPMPIVYGYSPSVVPRPPDWDAQKVVTGYWFLDEDAAWQPSGDLAAFLEAGPPPVYVGFGSMIDTEAQAVTRVVVDALRMAGLRAVLLGGWANLGGDALPETILKIDYAPHEWLFPRCAAVAHHGGAGTTAAGLRAGRPSVIVPFFADQPWWGQRVHALGVGPAPVPRKGLTAARLAAALQQAATDAGMRERAAALGEHIRAEDGVGQAVEVIEKLLGA